MSNRQKSEEEGEGVRTCNRSEGVASLLDPNVAPGVRRHAEADGFGGKRGIGGGDGGRGQRVNVCKRGVVRAVLEDVGADFTSGCG